MTINTFYTGNPNEFAGAFTTHPVITREFYGVLKRWTGSVWAKAKLKVYKSSVWVSAVLRLERAGDWEIVDSTGV